MFTFFCGKKDNSNELKTTKTILIKHTAYHKGEVIREWEEEVLIPNESEESTGKTLSQKFEEFNRNLAYELSSDKTNQRSICGMR